MSDDDRPPRRQDWRVVQQERERLQNLKKLVSAVPKAVSLIKAVNRETKPELFDKYTQELDRALAEVRTEAAKSPAEEKQVLAICEGALKDVSPTEQRDWHEEIQKFTQHCFRRERQLLADIKELKRESGESSNPTPVEE